MKRAIFILIFAFLLLCGCKTGSREADRVALKLDLYDSGSEISHDKPDLIYLVSTNVLSATDSEGRPQYIAALNDTDRMYFKKEFDYVNANISRGDFNLIAPYYHQYTFESIQLDGKDFEPVYKQVTQEVCEFFDWYVSSCNGGRKFVLAGFSQGAMLVLELLRHMDGEAFSRMAAAYMIGYRLSEDDLRHPQVNAASCADDRQVVISFNSVASAEGLWELVSGEAACCINPLNWRTDSTPAQFSYDGDTGTVRVDPELNVLMVDINPGKYERWMRESPVFSFLNPANRHHWDLMFYAREIHDNALLRVQKQ